MPRGEHAQPECIQHIYFCYGIGRNAHGNRIQHLVIYPELGPHPTSQFLSVKKRSVFAMRVVHVVALFFRNSRWVWRSADWKVRALLSAGVFVASVFPDLIVSVEIGP